MKKICIMFSLIVGISSFVVAQESWFKTVSVPLDGEKASQAMSDISTVDVSFCTTWVGTIAYSLSPAENKKLCYVVSNSSDVDVHVKIWFVDGGFTNDQRKNKSCQQDGQIMNFAQYVTGYEDVVSLPPRSEVQRFASLKFPENFTWTRNGCLVYSLGGVEMWGKVTFTVLMRKAKFIDVNFLEGEQVSHVKSKEYFLWIVLAFATVVRVIKKKISLKKRKK